MKSISYILGHEEDIEIGKQYYFGQILDGEFCGDVYELFESGASAIPFRGEDDRHTKIIAFKVVQKNEEDILSSLVIVTDIY